MVTNTTKPKENKIKKEKPNMIQRAEMLVNAGKVHKITDDLWWVESQTNQEKGYQVNYVLETCECPSYTRPCKHLIAVKIVKMKDLEQILYDAGLKAIKKIGII